MKALSRLGAALYALRPRYAATLFALLGIGAALCYAFSQETPLGSVRGRILLADTEDALPDVDIYLTPVIHTRNGEYDERTGHMRYARSDDDGTFSFNHVPAGLYRLSASTYAHSAQENEIMVVEGGATPTTLLLSRSQADLALSEHQRVFGTTEKTHIALQGYVDADKPDGHDHFHLRLFRARLSNIVQNAAASNALSSVERGYDPAPALPNALLHPTSGPAPVQIKSEDVRITEDDEEGFYHQSVSFGQLTPGLYLFDATHDKKLVCGYLIVTDTALVVKQAPGQLVAFAVDMKSGVPLPNCDVRAYLNGRVLAQRRTDSRGLAELSLGAKHPASSSEAEGDDDDSSSDNNGLREDGRLMTVVLRGTDEAVLSANGFERESDGGFKMCAYTDRPLYRPGQRIYFKGVLRRELAPASAASGILPPGAPSSASDSRYTVPANEPVKVEIRDPSHDRILKQALTTNAYGSISGSVDLNSEATTGVYALIIKARGQTYTHDIVVASYRKPEFAVTVTPDKKRYARGDTVTMTIQANYYFGSPLPGAKVSYSVSRQPDWESQYEDAEEAEESLRANRSVFHSAQESYYGEDVTNGETTLDENGKAVLTFRTDFTPDEYEAQQEKFTASVTVTEGEDREVTADGEALVVAGDFSLSIEQEGYLAAPNTPTRVTLTTKDFDGKPVPNIPIDLETTYEEWKPDKEGDMGFQSHLVGVQKVVTDAEGRAIVSVTPPRSGEMTLKARARDSKNRLITANASLWAISDSGDDLNTQYSDLALLSDKRRYLPGATARVLINADRLGETVLLTVEGDRVYRSLTLPITRHNNVAHIPILPEYGPNVSLSACYVRDKHFASSEIPLRVSMPQREIKISVTPDRPGTEEKPPRYQPGDKIAYRVRTTDVTGRPVPCEISLGVVDEAIYALQEDDPHALRDAFYPRRFNRVNTNYSFALEYLGDADKAEPKITARKRFPDTAFWQPTILTDANGQAFIKFALPDNLTTWRATVRAQSLDTRLGYAIDKVIETKDFFVRVQTPRTLTQRDESRIAVFVQNNTGAAQTALVRLEAENLTVGGDATRTLTVEAGKSVEALWPVTAEEQGEAKLSVTAWTPKRPDGGQYTDRVETTLPIRAHGREQVTAFAGQVSAANPETEVVRLDPNAIPAVSRLTVRITPSFAGALTGALDYLIGFPYGCTEQTMSRFLPDLLAHRVLRLNGAFAFPKSENLPRMTRDGLQRLYRFQHPQTGGWGWWEYDSDDAWMTAYVLYGLATAQQEGFEVNKSVLTKGRAAAVKMLATTPSQTRVFLLYALALAGDDKIAREQTPKIVAEKLDSEGLGYLLLLDQRFGLNAAPIWARLNRSVVLADGMMHWKDHNDSFDWDEMTATTVALRAMLAANPDDPRIMPTLRWLMFKRTGSYWLSTRDTSWVLAALCDYLAAHPRTALNGRVNVRLNGRLLQSFAFTPDLLNQEEVVMHIRAADLRPEKNDVTLERVGGDSPVFYSVELRQMVAADTLPAISTAQIVVKREYLRLTPHKEDDIWTLTPEETHNVLNQGDQIRVRLTLKVPRDMAYVLIEDPFPAGCEVNERGEASDVTEWSYWWSSIDVRDDRVAFFARSLDKGEHVIEYNLRAQTPGSYHALPTMLQAMYAPETRAESAETLVEIK